MEETHSSEMSVLANPHGATSQKTAFFMVTAMETSNPIIIRYLTAHDTHNSKIQIICLKHHLKNIAANYALYVHFADCEIALQMKLPHSCNFLPWER
jgi:hypothetical protein